MFVYGMNKIQENDMGRYICTRTGFHQFLFSFLFFFYRKQPKTFAFDHCLYSVEQSRENYASQEVVFDCLGRDILDNAFQGYNACIFAYGQTGKFLSIRFIACNVKIKTKKRSSRERPNIAFVS